MCCGLSAGPAQPSAITGLTAVPSSTAQDEPVSNFYALLPQLRVPTLLAGFQANFWFSPSPR